MTDPKSNIIPLSRFRAVLARPRGVRQVEALLSADDAAAAVAALSVPELYFLIKDVGLADAYDLIALAAPEQVRGCLDLEVWDRDRVQIEAAMPWLAAVAEAGFEHLGRTWEALDPELGALILARSAVIYDRSLEEEPDDSDERPMFNTPDGFFTVVLTSDSPDDQSLVYRVVEDLYRADMVMARHALMSARSELPAELEEMSYRWRSGRLADLGYVDFYQALEVFRPIDADSLRLDEDSAERLPQAEEGDEARGPGHLPAPMVEQVVGRVFLARALDQIVDRDEAIRLEAALLLLVNKVLAAARVEPGDEEAVKAGTEHATATLALGLETLARGDIDRAVELLGRTSLTRLHRLGYTVSLRLARLARALAPRAAAAGEPSVSVLAALLAARPFFARALDEPPAEGARPFESVADVQKVARHLTELALRIAVADALGVDLLALAEQPEPRPDLDDYARTALIRVMAGGELDPGPLSADEVARFRHGAVAGGELGAGAREAAAAALERGLDAAGVVAGRDFLPELLTRWLADIAASFGPLPAGAAIDPRYIGGVILQSARD